MHNIYKRITDRNESQLPQVQLKLKDKYTLDSPATQCMIEYAPAECRSLQREMHYLNPNG
ncbi:hypothetical protein [Shewanella fidelis]|uniref:Uncharacterized protein n=1 Tax=Shewanella fidelis TaxID=173509 RepID=A0ABU4H7Y5_9GAMM|nr:hypothetical protein [Shewanella fidelis]MDW4810752.1 hypothetical protein [Shewanella fidelis]MDW4814873.1 hypothetical protein [Shewanella fidelis]MDW4823360.1 hypothetical protein [Shewanella fidelis]